MLSIKRTVDTILYTVHTLATAVRFKVNCGLYSIFRSFLASPIKVWSQRPVHRQIKHFAFMYSCMIISATRVLKCNNREILQPDVNEDVDMRRNAKVTKYMLKQRYSIA